MAQIWRTVECQVGGYVLTHRPTGYFYIGSSGKVAKRIYAHFNMLKHGNHPNQRMQEIFTVNDEWSVETFPTKDLQEARDLEDDAIDKHRYNPLCCNVVGDLIDAAARARSIRFFLRRGGGDDLRRREHKPTGRIRPVMDQESQDYLSVLLGSSVEVDGVYFKNVAEVARKFGISRALVRYRINSDLTKYSGWFYIKRRGEEC